jgi:hypothetical protein
MKKILLLVCMTILSTVSYAGIIWDFDSATTIPIDVDRFGYFYAYVNDTIAGKGIGGTNALQITVPAHNRVGGGVSLISVPPLNLSRSPFVYGSVSADTTNPFGVAIEVKDNTGGKQFIPPPGPYTINAQKLVGKIDSTFKLLQFDLRSFNRYQGQGTPNLSAISEITFHFFSNTKNSTGPLHFYLDNVGASAKPLAPELAAPEKKNK